MVRSPVPSCPQNFQKKKTKKKRKENNKGKDKGKDKIPQPGSRSPSPPSPLHPLQSRPALQALSLTSPPCCHEACSSTPIPRLRPVKSPGVGWPAGQVLVTSSTPCCSHSHLPTHTSIGYTLLIQNTHACWPSATVCHPHAIQLLQTQRQ